MFRLFHGAEIEELIRVDRWAEQVYASYEKAAAEHTLDAFIRETDIEAVKRYSMYLPSITVAPHDILEKSYFPNDTNVCVVHHCRHMPAFAHQHELFEMSYLLSGTVDNIIGGETVHMTAGDICIVAPFVEHSLKQCDGILINILLRASTFEVTYQNVLRNFNTPLVSFLYNSCVCANAKSFFLLTADTCPEYVHELLQTLIVKKLGGANAQTTDIADTNLMSAILAMMAEYYPHVSNAQTDLKRLTNSTVIEVVRYLKQNYRDATLQGTAEKFGFSPSYLSRLIKTETGLRYIDILRRFKINAACVMLLETDESIWTIGSESGFESCSSFYKAFQALMGRTPHEYRMMTDAGKNDQGPHMN